MTYRNNSTRQKMYQAADEPTLSEEQAQLLDWGKQPEPFVQQRSFARRDHWGDLFESLGEPTDEELRPQDLAAALQRGRAAVQKHSARRPAIHVPATSLHLRCHLNEKDGYYPDAAIDTSAKRKHAAQPLSQRLKRLKEKCVCGRLKLYYLNLAELDDHCLYAPATVQAAKVRLEAWMRQHCISQCEWKLERGRRGRTHLHVVACAIETLSGRDVYDLYGLATYLVKPADARLTMPKAKHKQQYSWLELESQKIAAAEAWLEAIAMLKVQCFGPRKKLPKMLGSLSIKL